MCGRVVQKTPMSDIRVLFETVNPLPNAAPTYNGAPTDTLPIVRLDRDGRRSLDLLRWGLVPWWAKDIKMGAHCINAMAERASYVSAWCRARSTSRRRRRAQNPSGYTKSGCLAPDHRKTRRRTRKHRRRGPIVPAGSRRMPSNPRRTKSRYRQPA